MSSTDNGNHLPKTQSGASGNQFGQKFLANSLTARIR